MDVLVATLCDFASDYNGKLCLMGAFDTIFAPQLPVVHPQCSLALRVCFRPEDEGTHVFNINLVDADGNSLMKDPIKPQAEVKFPPDTYFMNRNLVLTIQRLVFQKEGNYSIDVQVGDKMLVEIPLRVVLVNQPKTN